MSGQRPAVVPKAMDECDDLGRLVALARALSAIDRMDDLRDAVVREGVAA